jgi:predicted MFS family arabinose efflux permease
MLDATAYRAQGSEPAPATGAASSSSGAYKYVCLAVLGLAYTFNFLDRQILSILAEPVKRDLHLKDTQLGLLTGLAFALFYTLFGLPIARLADRRRRVTIVAAACGLWSVCSAASGLASSFLTLALARIGVGVGEAGGTTPSYAIISDYFPPRRRGLALALFSLGVPLGIAFGAMLGGGVAARYGWRAAFAAVGLPGLVIALLILLVVREPVRGAQDVRDTASEAESASLGEVIALFARQPVLRWTALGTGLFAFVGYGMLQWTPAFLMRHQHMTLLQLSGVYGLCVGAAMAAGTWLSGWLADRMSLRSPRAYALIPFWGALLTAPFAALAFWAPSWQVSLACLTVTSATGILYLAPALAVVQNAAPIHARSTAAAVLLLILNLIGLGGGPLFVGVLSDLLAPRYGVDSLKLGLLALVPVLILTMGVYLLAARAMDRQQLEGGRTAR